MDDKSNVSDELLSDSSDSVVFLQELVYISDDEDEIEDKDFYEPAQQSTRQVKHQKTHQVLISVDASCNGVTAAGTCVIIDDDNFGTKAKSLDVLPGHDSRIAELATINAAVKWGCELIKGVRDMGETKVTTICVISDCQDMVNRWNAPYVTLNTLTDLLGLHQEAQSPDLLN